MFLIKCFFKHTALIRAFENSKSVINLIDMIYVYPINFEKLNFNLFSK